MVDPTPGPVFVVGMVADVAPVLRAVVVPVVWRLALFMLACMLNFLGLIYMLCRFVLESSDKGWKIFKDKDIYTYIN